MGQAVSPAAPAPLIRSRPFELEGSIQSTDRSKSTDQSKSAEQTVETSPGSSVRAGLEPPLGARTGAVVGAVRAQSGPRRAGASPRIAGSDRCKPSTEQLLRASAGQLVAKMPRDCRRAPKDADWKGTYARMHVHRRLEYERRREISAVPCVHCNRRCAERMQHVVGGVLQVSQWCWRCRRRSITQVQRGDYGMFAGSLLDIN